MVIKGRITSEVSRPEKAGIARALRNNGLTISLMAMFFVSWCGQALAGFRTTNADHRRHHEAEVTFAEYLRSGEFWSATGENWESEFLQMFCFIWMTTFLFQKGSPESNDPDEPQADALVNSDAGTLQSNSPAIVFLYRHSLTIAFLSLFMFSFVIHLLASAAHYNGELTRAGERMISTVSYLGISQFWFESLQNWQSEFFSVAAMVFLAVYLREAGSPESKKLSSSVDDHE